MNAITRYLSQASPIVFNGYAVVAAFSTYFCMYAFRKPFAVAMYDIPFEGHLADLFGWLALSLGWTGLTNLAWKPIFIIAQVLGYASSKFLGIKIISEMTPSKRAGAILLFIAVAEVGLLLFAILPNDLKLLGLIVNGLPLGMIWGLVFGFLEGRRTSEFLGAGLSAAYIVASGFVKSVGKWWMDSHGISEFWMPFVTGLTFAPFIILFILMLRYLPAPTAEDEAERVKREPMDGAARKSFFKTFTPGLLALTLLYMLLTAYRDFRDNFAAELWKELGYDNAAEIFTISELPIALAVMLSLVFIMRIHNNRLALDWVHYIMAAGTALVGVSTLLFQLGIMGGDYWMVFVGMGMYLAYVPFGCVLFDRLVACAGLMATAGFMIYVTDAFGYAGSVILTIYKYVGTPDLSWVRFFEFFSYGTSVICTAAFIFSKLYFDRHPLIQNREKAMEPPPTEA